MACLPQKKAESKGDWGPPPRFHNNMPINRDSDVEYQSADESGIDQYQLSLKESTQSESNYPSPDPKNEHIKAGGDGYDEPERGKKVFALPVNSNVQACLFTKRPAGSTSSPDRKPRSEG